MSQTPICGICLERYTPICQINSTTCGHIFHLGCILEWFRFSLSCPECRRSSPGIFPAYLSFKNIVSVDMTANSATTANGQQEIELLTKRLSITEEKHKITERELKDLKSKLKEQIVAIQSLLDKNN